MLLFPLAISAWGQELPFFEFVDLASVGITPVFVDRWGAAAADIDRNGWPDVFEIKWRGTENSQIYMKSGGQFQEISGQSPELSAAERAESWTRTPSFADYDNDGDKDLFWGSNDDMFLFANQANVFTNVTQAAGLQAVRVQGPSTGVGIEMGAWADYDLDGDLDLLVVQTNNRDFYLYRNDGGVFTNVAGPAGLTGVLPLGQYKDQGYWTGRIQWVDFDFDGDPDFASGTLLFRNDGGIFKEVSQELGLVASSPEVKFSDWFDYDNDGDLDFLKLVSGRELSTGTNELWAFQHGHFVDVSVESGINVSMPVRGEQSGLNIADFDNDGDQDIFIQDNDHSFIEAFLVNEEIQPGVRGFADVTQQVGLTQIGDRKGSVSLDYDMDGFVDIFIASAEKGVYLYHNVGNSNHWVGFILEGTQSNRDAIGALVTVVADGKRQIRHTRAPTTWKTQDNPFVHFGLGTATSIDSVIIRWPLGLVQVLTNVAADQYHSVKEPEATSVSASGSEIPEAWSLAQNYPNPFNAQTRIRYAMAKAGEVRIIISDLLGKEVRTFVVSHSSGGSFDIVWDGRDQKGQSVPSGIYVYRLEGADFVAVRKMVLMR